MIDIKVLKNDYIWYNFVNLTIFEGKILNLNIYDIFPSCFVYTLNQTRFARFSRGTKKFFIICKFFYFYDHLLKLIFLIILSIIK